MKRQLICVLTSALLGAPLALMVATENGSASMSGFIPMPTEKLDYNVKLCAAKPCGGQTKVAGQACFVQATKCDPLMHAFTFTPGKLLAKAGIEHKLNGKELGVTINIALGCPLTSSTGCASQDLLTWLSPTGGNVKKITTEQCKGNQNCGFCLWIPCIYKVVVNTPAWLQLLGAPPQLTFFEPGIKCKEWGVQLLPCPAGNWNDEWTCAQNNNNYNSGGGGNQAAAKK